MAHENDQRLDPNGDQGGGNGGKGGGQDGRSDGQQLTPIDPRAAEGMIGVNTADLLFFDESLFAVATRNVDPALEVRDLFISASKGREICATVEQLERTNEFQVEQDYDLTRRAEALVSDFRGSVTAFDYALYMKGKEEWDSQKYQGSHRFSVGTISAIADGNHVSALVEANHSRTGQSLLPPWQCMFPGVVAQYQEPPSGGSSQGGPQRGLRKIALKLDTGIFFKPDQDEFVDAYSTKVAVLLKEVAPSEYVGSEYPEITGNRNFRAEPIYSQKAWEEGITAVRADIHKIFNERSSNARGWGITLDDIAQRTTSFLTGFIFVEAEAKFRLFKDENGTLHLPADRMRYRITDNEVLHINGASILYGDNKERPINIIVRNDFLKGTPIIEFVDLSKRKQAS